MTAAKPLTMLAGIATANLFTATAPEAKAQCYRGGYYAAPPVYYAPPPVVYAPPPVYYSPPVYCAPRVYQPYAYSRPYCAPRRSFSFGFSYGRY
jgi:hypothetical protein